MNMPDARDNPTLPPGASHATSAQPAARVCVSRDGVRLGTIVGIQRDPATNLAKWAVLSGGALRRPRLFVPLRGAVPRRDGLHLPYDAWEVAAAPPVMDHTSMRLVEEIRLLEHYSLVGAPAAVPAAEHDTVTGLEWRPYRRARVRRVVRAEQVTHVVTVRREELVIDEEPADAVDRLEAAFGLVERPHREEVAMVLHREEVVLHRRVLPYERVRVTTVEVGAPWAFEGERVEPRRDPQLPPISL